MCLIMHEQERQKTNEKKFQIYLQRNVGLTPVQVVIINTCTHTQVIINKQLKS